MTHLQSRAPIILCLALLLGVACKDSPTMPTSGKEVGKPRKLMTAEDSAAFLASQPASPGGATATAITSIALKSGDTIVVRITSNECSGNPETVKVYGVISGVVAAGSCAGGLVGTQVTMGPASGDGTIYFTATHQVFGEGPPGNVSGADPDYTVGMNDGYGDTDFDDVILTVHVVPAPRLTCTPTPTRGADVTCTVSGTGVVVTGWSFTGPNYDGSGVHNLPGPSSGNSWTGPAVASGTVSAQVTINGTPRSTPLTADFTVQARTESIWHWGQKPRDWNYTEGTGLDCYPGDNFYYAQPSYLGWNSRTGTCDGAVITPHPRALPNSGYTVQPVDSGPNAGLWYVSSVNYRMLTESNINSSIKIGSAIVYQLVDKTEKRDCNKGGGPTITSVNFYTFNTKCRKRDLTGFFDGLWKHEGYGVSNSSGHQAQLEIAAALPINDMYAMEERVFAEGESNTRNAVVAEADRITAKLIIVGQDHANVHDNWSGWLWRWYPPSNMFFSSYVSF